MSKQNSTALSWLNLSIDRANEYCALYDKHSVEIPPALLYARDMAMSIVTSRHSKEGQLKDAYNALEEANEFALDDLYRRIYGIGITETPLEALTRLLEEPLANPILVASVYHVYLQEKAALEKAMGVRE